MTRNGRRMIGVLSACAVAALGAWAVVRAQDAKPAGPTDWPCYGGPKQDNISTESGWRTDWSAQAPAKLWEAKVGEGYSSVAVAGGKVYTMGNAGGQDTVWCLDAASGKEVWKKSYACGSARQNPGPRATPTVDEGRVYTVSRQGHIHCWDAASGELKWEKAPREFGGKAGSWGFAGSALIVEKNVIVDVGTVVCLDKATGNVVWKTQLRQAGYATPLLFTHKQQKCLAVFPADGLVILDLATGKELALFGDQQATVFTWKTSYDVNAPTPVVLGDKVFICSGYGRGCGLIDLSSGKAVYDKKVLAPHFTTPILYKGLLYGMHGQAKSKCTIVCLEPATGEVKWSQQVGTTGGMMMADGKLIIQEGAGELIAAEVSPQGYKELGRTKVLSGICWNTPVLSGGRIYCRNEPGDLVCLDVAGK